LKDEWFVGVKRGYGTRDFVDEVCRTAGFEPQYIFEGDEPARLSALVEADIGIAFIPSTAIYARDSIRYLAIEDQRMVGEIALLWHKSRYISRAAQRFREVVVNYFEALSAIN
jgi:DNA-binding transcriptional LysR family regulator